MTALALDLGSDTGLHRQIEFRRGFENDTAAADAKRSAFGWPDIDCALDTLGSPKNALDYLAAVLAWHMAAPVWTTDPLYTLIM